jgi:epoxyqueuosine reductase
MPGQVSFVSPIENLMKRHGFDHFGWTALERPLSMEVYRDWLNRGQHASMAYLQTHADLKEDPRRMAPRARSAVVVTRSYLPHPYGRSPLQGARTALYAQGEDYHFHFKAELQKAAAALQMDFPGEEFLCFTDSAPILERDLAYRAGLGWIGKNTCLIHPRRGSLFFLGQILTSLPAPESRPEPVPDHCGTCDRCLKACPTGALESPRWLNAGKCISYWTIEAREAAPESLRAGIGDWLFGCDICQTVCPWNEKHHGKDLMREMSAARMNEDGRAALVADLRWILTSSHNQLNKTLQRSPLSRARPQGLKRNALVVAGNRRLDELKPEIEKALEVDALKEVALWALAQLT